jgi:hypothetical protein
VDRSSSPLARALRSRGGPTLLSLARAHVSQNGVLTSAIAALFEIAKTLVQRALSPCGARHGMLPPCASSSHAGLSAGSVGLSAIAPYLCAAPRSAAAI